MDKLDLKKKLQHLYRASAKEPVEIEVPALRFLMVHGVGAPGSPLYAEAIEALYAVSYTAKFMVKKGPDPLDYAVIPPEGLWWADDMSAFITGAKDDWKWTMMILQPEIVSDAIIETAISTARTKKKLPVVDRLRLEEFTEGRCAQILHVGPFSEEGPTVQRLHNFINAQSSPTGKHHEIYLSDIRRAAPEKWKTILHQPMK
jgi:hypothetical protein